MNCKNTKKLIKSILNEIVKFNSSKIPNLHSQIKRLGIREIKKTGVGLYVDFKHNSYKKDKIKLINKSCCLSSELSLYIEGLNYSVNYELNISNGKIDFLEIVTNGENWDGCIPNYRFIKEGIKRYRRYRG